MESAHTGHHVLLWLIKVVFSLMGTRQSLVMYEIQQESVTTSRLTHIIFSFEEVKEHRLRH